MSSSEYLTRRKLKELKDTKQSSSDNEEERHQTKYELTTTEDVKRGVVGSAPTNSSRGIMTPSSSGIHTAKKEISVKNIQKINNFSVACERIAMKLGRHQICLALFLVLLGLVTYYFSGSPEANKEDILRKRIETMQNIFLGLNLEYSAYDIRWGYVMKSAVRSAIQKTEPKNPGVISLMNFHPDKGVTKRLAKHLAFNISSLLESNSVVRIDGKDLNNHDSTYVKHFIEDEVMKGIDRKELVILVENLQEIPAESILIFHGLCDDTNAPYKNVIYIFTLEFNEILDDSADKDPSKLEVTEPWKETLYVEQRSALESRIGTNKVAILPKH